MNSPHTEPDDRTWAFLSYSRADKLFVAGLAKSLDAAGLMSDWDQSSVDLTSVTTGISAEDEWWARLQDMIAAADVMGFVISPDSAKSPVCGEEIGSKPECSGHWVTVDS